ncbi:MAG: tyrosine--tRNA ligase [Candidatus Curtissbacteria bacterium]|nr:tyrosine--tRNA ligase [Candidatus Curtissbacteria bacterium]
MDQTDKALTRSVVEVLPSKDGLAKLMAKKKIRLYLGVDPTGGRLHLGHSIPLRKLQEFADLGHEAILVIGTGTVLAGDPSQRDSARPKITQEQIDEHMKDWKGQVEKIIDFNKVQIKQNGDWLLKLGLADILNIASNISATQLFKREMFQRRIDAGDTVWLHETLYPLLQGYDSVAMDVDLEIGGTDQTFNMLIGRELQKKMNKREKFVLTTPLISGTNGKQMSKTTGNCIWLDDSPTDMYGKIMSIPDSLIEEYWKNLTDLDESELKNLKPLDAKKKLAGEIVRIYHGEEEAAKAQGSFEKTFQRREGPEEVEAVEVTQGATLMDLLTQIGDSKSEAKRLIEQGGIDIDDKRAEDPNIQLEDGQLVKIGKRKFVKIRIK